MIKKPSYLLFGLSLVCCTAVLLGLWLETTQHLSPCVLCLLQRYCLVFLTAICFIHAFHHTKKWSYFLYYPLQLLSCSFGLWFSARQIYLQHLPKTDMTQCAPGLEFILHYMSWHQALPLLLGGTSECGAIDWAWLGIPLSIFSLALFLTAMIITIIKLRLSPQQ